MTPVQQGLSICARKVRCWLPGCPWLAAWLVLVMPAMALDASRKADSYSVQSWSTEQGLPSSKIRDVTETRDGYLWIVTAQGLARFDGSHFTVFTRATNPELGGGGFFSVVEAPDGTLWFGGDNGLFCRRNGHFEHFTSKDGLADDYVRMLFLSRDGTVVVCTRTGFSVIRDGRITTPGGAWKKISRGARSYLERADGSILLGNVDEVWLISGDHNEPFSGASGLQGNGFPSLAETPDGSVWIAHSRGLRRVYRDGKIEDYGEAQGLLDPQVAALRADRDGNLWIGTTAGVLYRLANGRIEAANYSEQSDTTPIRQIYEDREGGLWVATATGLFRLKDNISSNIGLAQGLKRTSVTTVLETREGAWWIGLMSGGVYRYDGLRATQSVALATAGISEVTSLAEEPGGTLWIGTLRGLYRYDGSSTITNLYQRLREAEWLEQLKARPDTVLPGLAHRRVNSMAADGSGGLWVATEGALYHEREGGFRAYTKSDGLPGNSCRSVIRSRLGDIWVTVPDGVGCLHEGRWTNYLCSRGIADVFPRMVFEDTKGTIWVTTDGGGINQFKDGSWRIFTVRDGLDDNYISGVTEDDFDNLWIACPSGIMRIPLKQFDELVAGRRTMLQPRLVNQSDGLPSGEVNQMGFPSACRVRDGRLLFATDRGVAVVQPGSLKTGGTRLPTYFERFIVNGDDIDLSGPLVVRPGNNDVQVYYTAISLLAAEKVRFKIRLDPLDRDWVDTGARRDVRYAKLPPGHYNFRVIACNSDGVWNETGATQAFIVQPFFYQTGWFAGLMLVIAGGLGFAIYRTYKLRLAKESAEAAVNAKNEFIAALKQAELERESLHKQLLETSHQAGMSEVASNVLHNVGNVLNSVNISATLVADLARQSKVVQFGKAVALLDEHAEDMAAFLTSDPMGVKLREYLRQLSQHLAYEQQISIAELDLLCKNIEHIKDIVTMQQSYAKVSGLTEVVNVVELVEDSLRMNDGALQQHQVKLVREYQDVPAITVEKHKVIQILVNVIRNAKHACKASGRADRQVTMRIANGDGQIEISVADNGIGIPPENLVRIFNHGFTTRKGGHGFGLHSGALAAKELGGVLTAHSDGPGHGAVFTLKLPLPPPAVHLSR